MASELKDLLYIDCCIRGSESRTRRLARAFLDALEERGGFAVEELILTEEALLPLQGDFFAQRERLLEAGDLDHPRFRYARRFARADRIVVAAPFWDLSVPALLKIYIENISVQGITFQADKLVFLTTRGGAYQDSPLETGLPFIRNLSIFFGIDHFDAVAVDGLDLMVRPPGILLQEGIDRARALAAEW